MPTLSIRLCVHLDFLHTRVHIDVALGLNCANAIGLVCMSDFATNGSMLAKITVYSDLIHTRFDGTSEAAVITCALNKILSYRYTCGETTCTCETMFNKENRQ